MERNSWSNTWGKAPRESAREYPSTTLLRTVATRLRRWAFSHCSATALRASSMVRPAPTRVASWRVMRASSAVLAPRRNRAKRVASRFAFSVVSFTSSGVSPCSRSSWRTWRAESPSSTPLLLRPRLSSALYSNAAISIFPGHAQHLFQAGLPLEHLVDAVAADAGSVLADEAFDGHLATGAVNGLAHCFVHHHQLVDAGTAAIAGVVALLAAHRMPDLLSRRKFDAHGEALLLGDRARGATIRAEGAHQPLGQYRQQGWREQEGLDPHVPHPGDGADGGVGVQGRHHQVTGQGCLHCDLGGLQVTDFPHHHHVRILTQYGAQAAGEGHVHLAVDLGLANPF